MDVLVIAAHPDDEALGCAGAMLKHARAGNRVHVLILTDGAGGRYTGEKAAGLKKAAERSAELLGAASLEIADFPNQGLDAVPLLELIQAVEAVMERVKPRVIYTHHYGDLNLDHQVAYRVAITAARPLPGSPVRDLYTYFVPSSSEWNQLTPQDAFLPNVYLDIADCLEEKIQAASFYGSEMRPYPYPRSPRALRAHAAQFGLQAGLEFAEPFQLMRKIEDQP
jgi:LmbE family N-acetylglucosaminyl deacetylase